MCFYPGFPGILLNPPGGPFGVTFDKLVFYRVLYSPNLYRILEEAIGGFGKVHEILGVARML
jgi:hypothetical protein